jgi:hypothetical protein
MSTSMDPMPWIKAAAWQGGDVTEPAMAGLKAGEAFVNVQRRNMMFPLELQKQKLAIQENQAQFETATLKNQETAREISAWQSDLPKFADWMSWTPEKRSTDPLPFQPQAKKTFDLIQEQGLRDAQRMHYNAAQTDLVTKRQTQARFANDTAKFMAEANKRGVDAEALEQIVNETFVDGFATNQSHVMLNRLAPLTPKLSDTQSRVDAYVKKEIATWPPDLPPPNEADIAVMKSAAYDKLNSSKMSGTRLADGSILQHVGNSLVQVLPNGQTKTIFEGPTSGELTATHLPILLKAQESYSNDDPKYVMLQELIDEIQQKRKQKTKTPSESIPPTITTKEEYDALTSGTVFIENGHKYRKP